MRASTLPQPIERILIIHQGALGDFICALPALECLRRAFPHAHMTLMGYPRILELVENRYYADTVVSVDRAEFARLYQTSRDYPTFLRKFFGTFQLIGVFGLARHPFVDNVQALSQATVVMVSPFPFQGEAVHTVDHLLSLPRSLGLAVHRNFPRLYPSQSDREAAEEVLANDGIDPDGLLIVAHPGSGSPAKNWSVANFLYLAKRLFTAYMAQVLFLVGPGEEEIKKDLRRPLGSRLPVIFDGFPLPQVAAILERCQVFVGNDSGMTHLAAAVGVPVVAIFGPSDPIRWVPKGSEVRLVRKAVSCSPCEREAMSRCDSRHCLSEISSDDVFRAVAQCIERWREGSIDVSVQPRTGCEELGVMGASL
ncbi:MAG: hypothetical protein GTN74_03575 [Proteobacteria bacterium]|nr:hypothetical protein [Pseudomonadota bacterium]NIS68371.1 hypothetical protein [Pseudomonadota bacterium]